MQRIWADNAHPTKSNRAHNREFEKLLYQLENDWSDWMFERWCGFRQCSMFADIRKSLRSSGSIRLGVTKSRSWRWVQLVAAILVMYPWGSVKVPSRRERCCIQHSKISFLIWEKARAHQLSPHARIKGSTLDTTWGNVESLLTFESS